ncbi:hypothetical protein [Butyrivibrio sp. YAB3001]|uniref:hypothetical protein n=1 Tax=Butyrivibrio sp. YAB3001 TaxID=1520812 RepID=UPI0008F62E7C|nr:hypothetical protein [Butyrivibrio sp. YAB3001]SFC23346.1 hypothetical protein SAMN02910398_01825 [Butyrivibrio sp. YAB3001]
MNSVIAINTFTGAKIPLDNAEGGRLDMCRATEVLVEEGLAKGLEKGLAKGLAKGLEKGRIEEREYINKLNSILLDSGRLDDLAKSTTDAEYQKQLIRELVDENYMK